MSASPAETVCRRWQRGAAACLLALLFTACDSVHVFLGLLVHFVPSGEVLRIRVGETKSVVGGFRFSGLSSPFPEVIVTSSDSNIAVVGPPWFHPREEGALTASDVFTLNVTGVAPGVVIITARAQGNLDLGVDSASWGFIVEPRDFRVTIAPTTLSFTSGSRARLSCMVSEGGISVPNPPVEWSSSQPAVAAVDQNGTVTGQADGTADITCRVSGSAASATAQVTVAPPPSTPPAAAIPGTYHLTGTKTFDECTPGTFPNSLDVDVVAEVTDDAGGTTITVSSKTEVSGGYRDPWIGTGNGSTILDGEPGILTETIKGQWQSGPVRLTGTVLYRFFIPGFGIDCAAGFDAMFTKR